MNLEEKLSIMSDADIIEFAENKDQEYYEKLEDVANGLSNGVFCIGPPGVGKTFDSENVLEQLGITHIDYLNSEWEKIPDSNPVEWECINLAKGNGPLTRASDYSEWALHADLYANRKGGVLLIDDNDSIMKNVIALSVMMKATEHKQIRPVDFTRAQFNTELSKYGVPAKFDFEGGLVILSNFKMKQQVDAYKGKTTAQPFITRWAALLDRMDYVDMELDHPRAVRVYVEHKIRKSAIYTNPNGYIARRFGRPLTEFEQESMLEWLRKNQFNFQLPLSLRTTNDIASTIIRCDGMDTEWKAKATRKLCKSI